MLLSDPALQELNWRPVAKGRMLALPVVEDLDVFKDRVGEFDSVVSSPGVH